jgi:hypothetical protein
MPSQYLLFSGDSYYPLGGWGDFIGSFPSVDEALLRVRTLTGDWWQIVDTSTMTVCESTGC